MKKLVVSPSARRDLADIYAHIAKEDPEAAARFLGDLTGRIHWIAEVDFTGMPRDHIRPGLRALPFKRRCIYFRSTADAILIVRVVHERQDVAALDFAGIPGMAASDRNH